MVKSIKILIYIFVFNSFLLAETSIYEETCVSCHKSLPVSLDKYFYRYLLKYSSEKNVKETLILYLQNPRKETTIMPTAFINRFGIKTKTKLKKKELISAINTYWEEYKIFGKLK